MATLTQENLNTLLTNLINENLSKNLKKLEGRFQQEQSDLSFVSTQSEKLIKTLKECEVLINDIAKNKALKDAYTTERSSTTRLNTESSATKNYGTNRDKSLGRKLESEKALDRNKSRKEMTRTKTSSNFNTNIPKKEDLKQLTLTKSKGNFMNNYNTHHVEETSRTITIPKTPKAEKSELKIAGAKTITKTATTGNLNSTPDLKNGKVVSKTPIQDEKTLKRNPTGKTLNTGKSKSKIPTEKSEDKPLKSNKFFKNLNSTSKISMEETIKNLKTMVNRLTGSEVNDQNKENLNNQGNKDGNTNLHHHTREENISQLIITPETQRINTEELLTKEDASIMHDFQKLKGEITVIQNQKIDYAEILDDKWAAFAKYLNRHDNVKILSLNKLFGRITVSNLIQEIKKEMSETENKIKEMTDKHPNEIAKPQTPFNLTRGALKAIELLNDNMYYKLFIEEGQVPSDDIILTYKIFFKLLTITEISEIQDKNEFWQKTCSFLVKDNENKMGTVIQNLVKNIDFSNENIYKISKMIGNNVSKLNPNYFSKLCGTTGLFIFFIKDALEYSGIIVDKKTSINRLFKNYTYINEVLQLKLDRLKKLQEKFFS